MVDEPNAVDKFMQDTGITGAFSGATDAVARKVSENTNLTENNVKGIMPWLAGGAAALVGTLLLQPIHWLVKGAFKALRNIVTLGGLLENIPIIGGLFSAIGDVIDTIGEYAGYIAPAIGAFIGYKAFQTTPSPEPETLADKAKAIAGAVEETAGKTVEVIKDVGGAIVDNAPTVGAVGAVGAVAAASAGAATPKPTTPAPATARQIAALETAFGGKAEFDTFHREKFGKPVSDGIDPRLTGERANQLIKHAESVHNEHFRAGTKATAATLPKPSLLRVPLNLIAKIPILGSIPVGIPLKIFDFTAEKIFGKEPPMSRSERLKEARSQTRGEMKSDSAKAAMRDEISRRFGSADAPESPATPKTATTEPAAAPDTPDAPAAAKPNAPAAEMPPASSAANAPESPTTPRAAPAEPAVAPDAPESPATPRAAATKPTAEAPPASGNTKPAASSNQPSPGSMVSDGYQFSYDPVEGDVARPVDETSVPRERTSSSPQSRSTGSSGATAVIDTPEVAAQAPRTAAPATGNTMTAAENIALQMENSAPLRNSAQPTPKVTTPSIEPGAPTASSTGNTSARGGLGAVRAIGAVSTIPALANALSENATTSDRLIAGGAVTAGGITVLAPKLATKYLSKLGPLGLVAVPDAIEQWSKEEKTAGDYVDATIASLYATSGTLATTALVSTAASTSVVAAPVAAPVAAGSGIGAAATGVAAVTLDAGKTVYDFGERKITTYHRNIAIRAIEELEIRDQSKLKAKTFRLPDGYEVMIPMMDTSYPLTPSSIAVHLHDDELNYNHKGEYSPLPTDIAKLYRMMGIAKQHKQNDEHIIRWIFAETKYAPIHDELSRHFRDIETYEDSVRAYIEHARTFNDRDRGRLIAELRASGDFTNVNLEEFVPTLSDGKGFIDNPPKITAARYPEAYQFLKEQMEGDFNVDDLSPKQQHHILRKAIPVRAAILEAAGAGHAEFDKLRLIHQQYSDYMMHEYVPYTDKLMRFEHIIAIDEEKIDRFTREIERINENKKIAEFDARLQAVFGDQIPPQFAPVSARSMPQPPSDALIPRQNPLDALIAEATDGVAHSSTQPIPLQPIDPNLPKPPQKGG